MNFFKKLFGNFQSANYENNEENVRVLPKKKIAKTSVNLKSPMVRKDINMTFYFALEEIFLNELKDEYTDETMENIIKSIVLEYGLVKIQIENNFNAVIKFLIDNKVIEEIDNSKIQMIIDKMTELNQIEYFDDTNNSIVRADIILYENLLLMTYYDSFSFEKSKVTMGFNTMFPINVVYEEFINEDGKSVYQIYINDALIIVNEDSKNIIMNHYKNYISRLNESKAKDKRIINSHIFEINSELENIIYNFCEYIPHDFLLNRNKFIMLEHVISFDNYYTRIICEINEDGRLLAGGLLNENEQINDYLKNWIHEKYRSFIKVIVNNSNIDSGDVLLPAITWGLIKKVVPSYFSSKWIHDYGFYFENINRKNLDEILKAYFDITEIDHLDENNIGFFTYYLMSTHDEFAEKAFIESVDLITEMAIEYANKRKFLSFENDLIHGKIDYYPNRLSAMDSMNGIDFEEFVAELFTNLGYFVEKTKTTGDQGLDLILNKNKKRIGVQVKCYSSTVGNKAIQEVLSGKEFYQTDKTMVVTNNYYTNSAKELAAKSGTILWDRDKLIEMIEITY